MRDDGLSGNGFQITDSNPGVTLRSFFGTSVPIFGTRPLEKFSAKIRISVPICEWIVV